jgi:hypothetical protein
MPTLFDSANSAHIYMPWHTLQSNPLLYQQLLEAPQNKVIKDILIEQGYLSVNKKATAQKEASEQALALKNNKPLVPLKGFTFGADPELFVKNPDGVIVCADMIPGTKDEPYKVKYGAVQRDGFAAEYNIDPCSTFAEWNRNHKAVQGQLQDMLPKGFTLVATPAHRFSPEVFEAAPDEAKELGCSPDWNAWEQSLNPPPKLPNDPYLRCAGGHLHAGWTEDADTTDLQHMMNGFDLTKQFDWFLGAWSVKHDKDVERRSLYGKAGACRIKPYGMEYRVLSNFWVMDKALRLEVWNRMVQAVACMQKQFQPDHGNSYNNVIRQMINSGKSTSGMLKQFSFPLTTIVNKLAA